MADQILRSGYLIDGKYRLERPIGKGGFSTVYQGVHTAMERTVAIKIFDPDDPAHSDPTAAAERADRFEREARLVSQLQHPNTVTIHDFGVEDDGKAYLVMEFIEGRTLGQLLNQDGPLDRERTVTIVHQILSSLEEAHHSDILHSDLKPANIMIAENFKQEEIVKVLDFGIARMLREHRSEGDADEPTFMGTPRYAAPEQLLVGKLTLATDVYGVGALMWACLLGRPMVPSGSIQDYLHHATSTQPWRIPADAGVDADLIDIIERAVRKSPADRYRDASAMLEALRACSFVDTLELPEIQSSPFDGTAPLVDPNVVAPDDGENLFLTPDADTGNDNPQPSSPGRGERKHKKERASSTSTGDESVVSVSEVTELELDLDDSPPTGRLEQRTSPRREISEEPSRIQRLLRPGAAMVVAMIVAGGLAIFFSSSDEASTDSKRPQTSADSEQLQHRAEVLEERADESPYSVNGILMAIRTQGWRIDQFREPVDLPQYRYRPVTAHQDEIRLDLTLYEVRQDDAKRELQKGISLPDQQVIFDHIVVRIRPRDANADSASIEMRKFLEQFRDMVYEEATN